jgi:hypothetical protein
MNGKQRNDRTIAILIDGIAVLNPLEKLTATPTARAMVTGAKNGQYLPAKLGGRSPRLATRHAKIIDGSNITIEEAASKIDPCGRNIAKKKARLATLLTNQNGSNRQNLSSKRPRIKTKTGMANISMAMTSAAYSDIIAG